MKFRSVVPSYLALFFSPFLSTQFSTLLSFSFFPSIPLIAHTRTLDNSGITLLPGSPLASLDLPVFFLVLLFKQLLLTRTYTLIPTSLVISPTPFHFPSHTYTRIQRCQHRITPQHLRCRQRRSTLLSHQAWSSDQTENPAAPAQTGRAGPRSGNPRPRRTPRTLLQHLELELEQPPPSEPPLQSQDRHHSTMRKNALQTRKSSVGRHGRSCTQWQPTTRTNLRPWNNRP